MDRMTAGLTTSAAMGACVQAIEPVLETKLSSVRIEAVWIVTLLRARVYWSSQY
jgi:hypothetical protein